MSLSVCSFPEAPPKLVQQQPKWQVTPSLKSSGRFLGTLLSKRPVPLLKGIGHFTKTHVKGGIIRQRANVSRRSRWLSERLSRSSIRSSSIVIDITPLSNNYKYSSARSSDVDASSLNPTIEISLSPTISPVAISSPTAAKDFSAISPTNSVKAPYQASVQSLVGDSAPAHETVVQHEEVASDSDSEPHDPQRPNSEITTPSPISRSLTTQLLTVPVPSTEGRRRSHSVSAGVKASATKTVPPTLPRCKSETAIGLPRVTITPSEPIPQAPATGSTHTSESTSTKKQNQQRRESIFKRVRARSAGASSKSTGSNKAMEMPPLRARLFSMRSLGSRLSANGHHDSSPAPPPLQPFSTSATAVVPVPKPSPEKMDLLLLQAPPHFHPNTSDVAASPQSQSPPSPVVGPASSPLDDDSEQSPPPNSVLERGLWLRLAAVPHVESWDGEQQRGRPRTTP